MSTQLHSTNTLAEPFPGVPGRGLVTAAGIAMRLEYLKAKGIDATQIARSGLAPEDIRGNIESSIGSVEIPVGLVGPLLYNHRGISEQVYCPAATLEGALIASMNRGAKAISLSGGFTASVQWQRMSRAPMFLFANANEAILFERFVARHFAEIKALAAEYSNHAVLQHINSVRSGETVHLKFVYTTGDASGQNMTTTCTWHAMIFIADSFREQSGITPLDFVVEGNGSSDKKVSAYNMENGRGVHVSASCFLPEKIIADILRTNSDSFMRCYLPSRELAQKDGMMGYSINAANAVAAIFAATGQDLACIHESGVGVLHLEQSENGLHLSLNLPNLVIGTVGGGTQLKKQAEALQMMGCLGSGKVERFAELIAGFALGLEISTFAAIVSGEFAKAHEKLGRNKPVQWLLRSELNTEFIKPGLNETFRDKANLELKPCSVDVLENGIITTVAARINRKLIGFVPLELSYRTADGNTVQQTVLLKSKALDEDVIKGLHVIAASIDPRLSDLLKAHKDSLEYKNSHLKETELYTLLHRAAYPHIPAFYGQHTDHKREIHYFIQELLDYTQLKIINSENRPELWSHADIMAAIHAINAFHQLNLQQDTAHLDTFKAWEAAPLYKKLLNILIGEKAEGRNIARLNRLLMQMDSLEAEARTIRMPRCAIHNDFNPRNTAVDASGRIIIYDWELAVVDFPQRDVCEFLSFVLPEDFSTETLMQYLNAQHAFYPEISKQEWLKACRYALKTYIAGRVSFYEVSGILVRYEFSGRILNTAFRMLEILEAYE